MKKQLKTIFLNATIYYTLITLLMYTIGSLALNEQMVPRLSIMYEILIFSLLVSFVNQIFHTKLNSFAKYTIHFLGIGVAYFVLFLLISGNADQGNFILIGMGLYTFIYLIIAFLLFVIRALICKKKNEAIPYKRQF